jgi:hypothetical protein
MTLLLLTYLFLDSSHIFSHLEVADTELVLLADAANSVHQAVPLPLPVAAAARHRAVGPRRPGRPPGAAANVAGLRLLCLPFAAGGHRRSVIITVSLLLQQAVARPPAAATTAAGAAL